jgi:hypothetical protein
MNTTTNFVALDFEDRHVAAMQAGLWGIEKEGYKCLPLEKAKVTEIFVGYCYHYKNDEYRPVEAEAERKFSIPNSSFEMYGKLDTIVVRINDTKNGLIQLEHKTGSRDANSDDVFPFKTSAVSSQITTYAMLQSAAGQPLDYSVLDYIRVPSIRPKIIPAGTDAKQTGTLREVRGLGTYFGYYLSAATKDIYKEGEKIKENTEAYQYRLRKDIADNPERYYSRKGPIVRNNVEIINQLLTLEQVTREIDRAEEEEHLGSYYMNTSQCLNYGSECEFMSLCDGTSTPDSEDFEHRGGASGSGSSNLSFSKVTTFMSCRRKFYHRYIQKLQKRHSGSKSLRIGSLFHIALENYYNSLINSQGEENDD